jgi:putative sterol carrier protein
MSLESATTAIRNKVGEDCGLGASLKFDMGDDGVILIDATVVPNVVTNDDKDAQCTIGVALADLDAMMAGELDPTVAFMSGKLRVEGDMSVAMKLSGVMT